MNPTAEAILKAREKVFLSPRIAATFFFACLIALLVGPHFAVVAPLVQQHAESSDSRSRRGNYVRNLAADHLEEIPSLQEISL